MLNSKACLTIGKACFTSQSMIEIVRTAAKAAGGINALADRLGIKRQAFYMWRRVPAERVLDIEAATGVSRHDLRPDIYPREAA